MNNIKPKNIKGTKIFVIPHQEKSESGLILPNQTGDQKNPSEMSHWYEITRTGEEVTDYNAGDIVMMSPRVVARSEFFDFGMEDADGNIIREAMMDISNVLAEADLSGDLQV